MDTTLVLTWGISNAVSWAFSGINSPIGDMLRSSGFKTLMYLIGLSASIIALITTYTIFYSQTNDPVFTLSGLSVKNGWLKMPF